MHIKTNSSDPMPSLLSQLNIGLAQMEVVPGKIEHNLKTMLSCIDDAREQQLDMIAFPELCLSGYLLGDWWTDDSFCQYLMDLNEEIKQASRDITVIYGNIYVPQFEQAAFCYKNQDGRALKYNAVYVYHNQQSVKRDVDANQPLALQHVYAKNLLANYREFDDQRYFTSHYELLLKHGGDPSAAFAPFIVPTKNGGDIRLATQVCEDFWWQYYAVNPSKEMIAHHADLIINVSASPWTYQKNIARQKMLQSIINDVKRDDLDMVPLCYVNCVGAQNNGKNTFVFDGASVAYNQSGEIIAAANNHFKPELLSVDLSHSKAVEANFLIEQQPKIQEKIQAIHRSLKHISEMAHQHDPLKQKWVIGLSGGIDSAVSACNLVAVFGQENVIAVNMPSQFNSDKTKNAAAKLAKNLGIDLLHIPIDAIDSTVDQVINQSTSDRLHRSELNAENEQARLRGMILCAVAARHNAWVINNGNKLECWTGYATLYGDIIGAIASINDLTKEEVYEAALWYNRDHDIIPNDMIPEDNWQFDNAKIYPSAELAHHQKDPFKIGYHCRLIERHFLAYHKGSIEQILQHWLDGTLHSYLDLDLDVFQRYQLDDASIFIDDLKWFWDKKFYNTFKRVQNQSTVCTSTSAFGYDHRESILPPFWTRRAHQLEQLIIKQGRY